ncbi:MAG: DUF2634 domain-containing protein [Acidaminococcaceae bacterium]|nr:DUF2634 domain-containing protein [Acidaminococcaceae bacterium]MBQ9634691.1 DUF2634 domain-containing protein [Acidaminococcaceae bacterium]
MFPDDNVMAAIRISIDTAGSENQEVGVSTDVKLATKVGRSFAFDYDKKEFVFTDGVNEELTQLDAIKQWIRLFISTKVNAYKIYTETFGVDTEDLVGWRLPRTVIVSEIKRRITEGILNKCPCVDAVYDWQFNKGTFSFTVKTNTGEEATISDVY